MKVVRTDLERRNLPTDLAQTDQNEETEFT